MKTVSARHQDRKALLGLFCSLNKIGKDICLEYARLAAIDAAIKNHEIKIAIDNEIIVGTIVLTPIRNSIYISALIVKAGSRKKGVGTKLIQEAIKKAKRLNKSKVVVETAFVYRAKKFYEKCGFRVTKKHYDCWALKKDV